MRKEYWIILSCTLIALTVSILIYYNRFLDMDVVWHVEGGRRLLAGGNYLKNVFDDNAPSVFAFYFPVVWLHQLLGIQFLNLIISYVSAVNLLSLGLCYFLIQKGYRSQTSFYRQALYITLLFIELFLPISGVGHREVMLVALFLPYLLYMQFCALDKSFQLSKTMQCFLAILAAFGIMQNLIYLLMVIIIDIYRKSQGIQRQFSQAIFYIAVLVQCLVIAIVYPEYIFKIIPMVLCYEGGFNAPILDLLHIYSVIPLATISIVIAYWRKLFHRNDIQILFFATLCAFLIYLVEKKLWYYHLYPALAFALWLNITLQLKHFYEQSIDLNFTAICVLGAAMLAALISVTRIAIKDTYVFHNSHSVNNLWNSYINSHFSGKSLFFFTMQGDPAHMLPLYNHSQVVSPWFNPWFMPYILQLQKGHRRLSCDLKRDIAVINKLYTSSLQQVGPDVVMIRISRSPIAVPNDLKYTTIFSQQNIISKLSNYRYYDTFQKTLIYVKDQR